MANLLTSIRLLLIPVLVLSLLGRLASPDWLLLLIVVIAILSDYFDGIVARARGTASPWGMLFDHSTDFLFVTSGLFAAALAGHLTLWLPVLIVIAFSQYVLDSYFLFHQKQLRMSAIGRWNGIFYFVPLLMLAIARISPESLSGLLLDILPVLALLLLLSTLLSIVDRGLAPRHKEAN